MKLDIKKLYKQTIKTLEAHEMEVTIALAALTLLAFAPEDTQEKQKHDSMEAFYKRLLEMVQNDIELIKSMMAQE